MVVITDDEKMTFKSEFWRSSNRPLQNLKLCFVSVVLRIVNLYGKKNIKMKKRKKKIKTREVNRYYTISTFFWISCFMFHVHKSTLSLVPFKNLKKDYDNPVEPV